MDLRSSVFGSVGYFSTADGGDAVNNTNVNRPCGSDVGDDMGDAVSGVSILTLLFLDSRKFEVVILSQGMERRTVPNSTFA